MSDEGMTDSSDAQPDRPPAGIHEYRLPGGWELLVGRTAAANDHLSLRLARPGDLWFHVRGMPGSHVILRVPPGAAPDRSTQELAAAIAAYHSKARSGGTVPVSCTEARHVSKLPRAPAGTVTIRKERLFKVQPIAESTLTTLRVD